jgi:hypothetical protein
MRAQKGKKSTKSLKHAKAIQKKKPLLTITLKEVYVTHVPMSGGGSEPPTTPPTK